MDSQNIAKELQGAVQFYVLYRSATTANDSDNVKEFKHRIAKQILKSLADTYKSQNISNVALDLLITVSTNDFSQRMQNKKLSEYKNTHQLMIELHEQVAAQMEQLFDTHQRIVLDEMKRNFEELSKRILELESKNKKLKRKDKKLEKRIINLEQRIAKNEN